MSVVLHQPHKTLLTPRSHSFTRLQDGRFEMADAQWGCDQGPPTPTMTDAVKKCNWGFSLNWRLMNVVRKWLSVGRKCSRAQWNLHKNVREEGNIMGWRLDIHIHTQVGSLHTNKMFFHLNLGWMLVLLSSNGWWSVNFKRKFIPTR